MNQQQQQDMYYDYPTTANRSPGSTRQGYATIGHGNRHGGQRQPHLHNPALYAPDDRSSIGYDSLSRFDRLGGMQSGYMLDNNQTWGYNGGVATMNGPINGNGRLGSRAVNRRAALPTVREYPPRRD
jgi:hypothetical protein